MASVVTVMMLLRTATNKKYCYNDKINKATKAEKLLKTVKYLLWQFFQCLSY